MLNIDANGNLTDQTAKPKQPQKPKHVQVDHSTKASWLKSLAELYKQTIQFPDDAGALSSYNAEKLLFNDRYPAAPEGSLEAKHQSQMTGDSPELMKAGATHELDNLRAHLLAAEGSDRLQLISAYREQLGHHVRAFPEDVPPHIQMDFNDPNIEIID